MVGDLKYGRTVHSLVQAMSPFNPTFNFISHPKLRMPQEYLEFLDSKGVRYYEHETFTDILSAADIVYMTRVQRERFQDLMEYEKTKDLYILKNSMLENTKPTMKILHPLPRINEISQDVDPNPKAYYFEQACNGVYARQAVISYVLGLRK
jgi:aspartate carbamoyltransferase catalytic subunit